MRLEPRHAHVLQQLADADPTLLEISEGQEFSPAFVAALVAQELDFQAADRMPCWNPAAPLLSKIEKAQYNFFDNIAQMNPDAPHSTDIPRSIWEFETDMLLASAEQ